VNQRRISRSRNRDTLDFDTRCEAKRRLSLSAPRPHLPQPRQANDDLDAVRPLFLERATSHEPFTLGSLLSSTLLFLSRRLLVILPASLKGTLHRQQSSTHTQSLCQLDGTCSTSFHHVCCTASSPFLQSGRMSSIQHACTSTPCSAVPDEADLAAGIGSRHRHCYCVSDIIAAAIDRCTFTITRTQLKSTPPSQDIPLRADHPMLTSGVSNERFKTCPKHETLNLCLRL
jgi:hypothetical protein